MVAQLVTAVALALSTAVAATAVSIGIARADGLGAAVDPNTHVAVAILLSLVLGRPHLIHDPQPVEEASQVGGRGAQSSAHLSRGNMYRRKHVYERAAPTTTHRSSSIRRLRRRRS